MNEVDVAEALEQRNAVAEALAAVFDAQDMFEEESPAWDMVTDAADRLVGVLRGMDARIAVAVGWSMSGVTQAMVWESECDDLWFADYVDAHIGLDGMFTGDSCGSLTKPCVGVHHAEGEDCGLLTRDLTEFAARMRVWGRTRM